jgi:hypothetical protein
MEAGVQIFRRSALLVLPLGSASGAADEERIANRIADQEEKLAALFKQREALIGNA